MAIKFFSQAVLSLALLSLLACGGGKSSGGGSGQEKSGQQEARSSKQLFRAVLKPMNPTMSGETSGVVLFRIENDDLVVEETVINAPTDVRHFQAVMAGKSCAAIDDNQDGYIDIVEGMKVFSQRLIPLDSNLDSQIEGMDFGPIANEANAFVYRRSTSLSKLLSDLTATDPNDEDDLVKIGQEKNLKLASRVVVIFGTNRAVPDTVQGNITYSPSEGLPIACGELESFKEELTVE